MHVLPPPTPAYVSLCGREGQVFVYAWLSTLRKEHPFRPLCGEHIGFIAVVTDSSQLSILLPNLVVPAFAHIDCVYAT